MQKLGDKKCAELDVGGTKVSEVWKSFKKMSNITLIRMQTLDTHKKSLLTENRSEVLNKIP